MSNNCTIVIITEWNPMHCYIEKTAKLIMTFDTTAAIFIIKLLDIIFCVCKVILYFKYNKI